jgi:hypothetical protein
MELRFTPPWTPTAVVVSENFSSCWYRFALSHAAASGRQAGTGSCMVIYNWTQCICRSKPVKEDRQYEVLVVYVLCRAVSLYLLKAYEMVLQ